MPRRTNRRSVRFGGESPSGWLPANAAMPPATLEWIGDVWIEEQETGDALLFIPFADGEGHNDTWFVDFDAAIEEAKRRFGLSKADWTIMLDG